YFRAGPLGRIHDLPGRLVEELVIVRLQANTNLRGGHASVSPYSRILVTTPAPTVRPPSRMAKRRPSSQAIGVMSSISRFVLPPGMIISVPCLSVHTPVTSVVRK